MTEDNANTKEAHNGSQVHCRRLKIVEDKVVDAIEVMTTMRGVFFFVFFVFFFSFLFSLLTAMASIFVNA